MMRTPKVSIITISLNCADVICDCLKSVAQQDYMFLEHIVIDGGSTDGTVAILEQHQPRGGFYISEPDHGIYNAINKGILRCSGDVIAILNADNFYTNPDIVSSMVRKLVETSVQIVYGDAEIVDSRNILSVKRLWISGHYSENSFRRGWMPPHQTIFLTRKVHEVFGLYSECLKIASDYEFLLRVILKNQLSCAYNPRIAVTARNGGVSNRSVKMVFSANMEVLEAWRMNGLRPPIMLPFIKPTSKLLQFLRAKVRKK